MGCQRLRVTGGRQARSVGVTLDREASLASYQELLERYLDDSGALHYAQWHASEGDVAALDALLESWRQSSPDNRPDAFGSAASRLSYWLNLYNALVIREVLRHWPLESVRDVRPTMLSKVVTLKGFFRDLRFDVGGRRMNLGDIENKVIRSQFKDARIHFAINCGSASCPILRKSVFDGAELEAQLDQASREFVADDANVAVDLVRREVRLSKIFSWYKDDFKTHARALSGNSKVGTLEVVILFARGEKRKALERAQGEGFALRYQDYDWALNKA